jgi:hypothetical protein
MVIGVADKKPLNLQGDIDMYDCYVERNANENGEHIVHSEPCSLSPKQDQLRYIGVRSNIQAPLNEASDFYPKVAACPKCMGT